MESECERRDEYAEFGRRLSITVKRYFPGKRRKHSSAQPARARESIGEVASRAQRRASPAPSLRARFLTAGTLAGNRVGRQ